MSLPPVWGCSRGLLISDSSAPQVASQRQTPTEEAWYMAWIVVVPPAPPPSRWEPGGNDAGACRVRRRPAEPMRFGTADPGGDPGRPGPTGVPGSDAGGHF